MENKVVVSKELDKEKVRFLNHLKSFKNSVDRQEHFLVSGGAINGIGWVDAFRFFIDEINSYHSPAKDLVISSMYRINKSCPLVVPAYFEVLTGGTIDRGVGSSRIGSNALLEQFRSFPDHFLRENKDKLFECLQRAGTTGTVSIVPTVTDEEMRIDSGFRTLCKISSFFEPYFESQEIKDCAFVIYSGAILDIGEIHHILQSSYETKQCVIIICSNLSEDVDNTLLVNWQQGKTFVIPFLIEDSFDTLNEFRDIAMVTGETLVSKESGLRLSSVDIKDKKSYTATFNSSKKSLTINLDNESSQRCLSLRKRTTKKLQREKIQDVRDILKKRLARMSARNVEMRLKIQEIEKGLIEDKASAFFTYFSKCAQQGVTKVQSMYGIEYLPSLELDRAIAMAKHDLKCIQDIKAMVRLEE